MPEVYVFRHAHVDYTPPAQITEHSPLTPLGHEMAQLLAERCEVWDLQHLFISSMLRTRQTAAPILARFPNLPSTVMDGLRETNIADLAEFDGPAPAEDMHQWQDAHYAHANTVMWQRVVAAWAEIQALLEEQGLERVGIVTHGGPINALIRHFMGQPVERLRTCWYELDWSATCCLQYQHERKLVRWVNDARHIDALRDRLG